MADKKSDPKKAAPAKPAPAGHLFELEVTIIMVIGFVVIIYFATNKAVLQYLGIGQDNLTNSITGGVNQGLYFFNGVFNLVIFFSVFLILLFVLGGFYFKHKHKEILTLYKMGLPKGYIASLSSTAVSGASVGGSTAGDISGVMVGAMTSENSKPVLNPSGENKKWDEIQKHIASMNSSDWRMAILEADILLYEMLDQMGYDGDTVAEKLKVIESSDFSNLDSAWRAHKVRNTIAHEGASYELSHEQAQNTIDLYRKVFEEFYFI